MGVISTWTIINHVKNAFQLLNVLLFIYVRYWIDPTKNAKSYTIPIIEVSYIPMYHNDVNINVNIMIVFVTLMEIDMKNKCKWIASDDVHVHVLCPYICHMCIIYVFSIHIYKIINIIWFLSYKLRCINKVCSCAN